MCDDCYTCDDCEFEFTRKSLFSEQKRPGAVDLCLFLTNSDNALAFVYNENMGWMLIDKEGKQVSDVCFASVEPFVEGFSVVGKYDITSLLEPTRRNLPLSERVQGKQVYNYIDSKGKFISPLWFSICSPFSMGYGRVHDYKKGENYIDRYGKLISDEWFYSASQFKENGLAIVSRKDGAMTTSNYLKLDGTFLLKRWYPFVEEFKDGKAKISSYSENYVIDEKGKFITNYFKNYSYNKGYFFVNGCGKLLTKEYFSEARDFVNGLSLVKTSKGYNFLKEDGTFLFKEFYYKLKPFDECGFAQVMFGRDRNYIDKNEKIVSDISFGQLWPFEKFENQPFCYAVVKLRTGELNILRNDGKLML